MTEIIFENRDLIVCIKPPAVPSQPDLSGDEDMTAILRSHLEKAGEKSEIFVVHRLDRGVGGVMVYAKTKGACVSLSQAVASKDGFNKEYLAVVSGAPEADSGTYEDYIFKDARLRKAFVGGKERKGAKLASLDYSLLHTVRTGEKVYSLLKIKLNTGRYHQIRAQLSSRGMPICGDGKYGSRERGGDIALWSYYLSFDHGREHFCFCKTPDADKEFWNLFDIKHEI